MRQFFSSKLFSRLVIGVVVTAVIYGVFLAGSPITQRMLQFDKKRDTDLNQISFAIDEYWARNTKLPEILEDLQDSRYYRVESLVDPKTKEPYEYTVLEEKRYELCAVFETDSEERKASPGVPRMQGMSFFGEHGAGRTCFQLEVQPRISP